MSSEDLERYETEIELQLYREYRDVLPMFQYVVETERRFYLANEVDLEVKHEDGRTYFDSPPRRVGLGHVPPHALRRRRARRHLQGRQHRGASRQGALTWRADAAPRRPARAGEDAVADVVRRARLRGRRPQLAACAKARSTWSPATRRDRRVLRGEDPRGARRSACPSRRSRPRSSSACGCSPGSGSPAHPGGAADAALRRRVRVVPDGAGGWSIDVLEAAF